MRPVDFQLRSYVEELASLLIFLAQKIPLVILAWLLFGLQLPADPALWGCFLISLLLGQALLFCFDWAFACIAFYSTETWGLSVVRVGVAAFFSGSLLPLQMVSAVGLLAALGGFVLGAYYMVLYFTSSIAVPGFASTIVAVLMLGGVQLLALGVIGEYLGRLHLNVNRKPQFIVRQVCRAPRADADPSQRRATKDEPI